MVAINVIVLTRGVAYSRSVFPRPRPTTDSGSAKIVEYVPIRGRARSSVRLRPAWPATSNYQYLRHAGCPKIREQLESIAAELEAIHKAHRHHPAGPTGVHCTTHTKGEPVMSSWKRAAKPYGTFGVSEIKLAKDRRAEAKSAEPELVAELSEETESAEPATTASDGTFAKGRTGQGHAHGGGV
jgi:hypothetical protein